MHQKLPHYFLLGKPILAIVPEDSAVAQIIHKTNSGCVVPVEGDWRKSLEEFFDAYSKGSFHYQPNVTAIEDYNWNNISKKWRKVIGC
jgi:hypothetical protein